ncbi:hypothetical protein [Oscillatoria acuminata]|uniref:Aminoglycoside phosphotransferase domain-containing protein n=1 Tax=Oscillatoria acuminata PCC 6304 TaxID=56110 RepID=K9TKT1_9CYAN|nr:hypothetical protein [Oscillatoria acuminata]AFY83008.1 hypothetical protein Oscil6304_3439 [Oscillatoria acuminata PCC 6304]
MFKQKFEDYEEFISALPKLEAKLSPLASPESHFFLEWSSGHYRVANLANFLSLLQSFSHRGGRMQRLVAVTRFFLYSHPTIETHATSIRLGSDVSKGLRLFYPHVTLKVRQKSRSEGDNPTKPWFINEQEGRDLLRQKLGDSTAVRVPQVFAAGEYGNLSYLLEERLSIRVLNPQKREDRQLLIDRFLPSLLTWYSSPQWQPYSSVFSETITDLLEDALRSAAIADLNPAQSQRFYKLVDQLPELDMAVPFVAGLGDMCLSNACVGPNEELVLMDWEAHHTRPVALEFDRLIRPFGIGSEVHQAIRQAYSQQFEISPELFDRQLYLFNLIGCSRQLLSVSTLKDPQKRQYSLHLSQILLKAAEEFAQTAQHGSGDKSISSPVLRSIS